MALVRRRRRCGKAKLVIVREDDARGALGWSRRWGEAAHAPPGLEGKALPSYAAFATLPGRADFDKAVAQAGAPRRALACRWRAKRLITTNAIGWLPGSDPKAGVILVTAHPRPSRPESRRHDHVRCERRCLGHHCGARAGAGGWPRRSGPGAGCCSSPGSEEIGGYGVELVRRFTRRCRSTRSSPIIEIEMIGAQDPKLPAGTDDDDRLRAL